MAKLFPIGTMAASTSSGSMGSISYKFFEPNLRCSSNAKHNILVTQFEQQTMLARKKSAPMLTITYEYEGILSKEYRQIEHFVDDVEDALTSFYTPDLSRGQTPSAIADSGGDWVVSITNTRLFSTQANLKANRVLLWDGINWKEGNITTIVTNTSVTVNVDELNYGGLTLANAQGGGLIYPLYEVYLSPGALGNFKSTIYIDEKLNLTDVGGWMYDGSITFVSRYRV